MEEGRKRKASTLEEGITVNDPLASFQRGPTETMSLPVVTIHEPIGSEIPNPLQAFAATTAVATATNQPQEQPSRSDGTIHEPYETDVLFGRGRHHRDHPGNVKMQLLVDIHRDAYYKADRDGKTSITTSIVRIIKAGGGRFIKRDKDQNRWEEVEDESARHKIGHAMRDGRTTRPSQPIDVTIWDGVPQTDTLVRQALERMRMLCKDWNRKQAALGEEDAKLLTGFLESSDDSGNEKRHG